MTTKKVVVAGATGITGAAALHYFGTSTDADVVALSRRRPRDLYGAKHVALDLTNAAQCVATATELKNTTHLVYTALYEEPNLIDGWSDRRQITINDTMLRNLMGAIEPVSPSLKHVTLLQGTKAYGVHLGSMDIPAREGRSEVYDQPNFYWEQENFIRELQRGKDWHWSILRPVLIIGLGMGSAMDVIPPLGVYAAIMREQGRGLDYPGGAAQIMQAVDSDLLAHAIAWAGDAESARNEVFNVTNGDVFTWENVWPAIADALGMEPGNAVPQSMASELPNWAATWDILRHRHNLISPSLKEFVGQSFQYADLIMGNSQVKSRPPVFVSSVKINHAGFTEMMDTEDMFRKWLLRAKENRLLP